MSFNTRKIRSEKNRICLDLINKGKHLEAAKVEKWSPKERAAYLLAIDSTPVIAEDYENIIVFHLRRKAS